MIEPLAREKQKLYALPRAEFTAARNARARALKADDPELAAAVAALPKPSLAAAALNDLVREDPSEVRALVQSGRRLRTAQEAAVAGKKGGDLNEAIAEHRRALDRVLRDLRRRRLGAATLEKATRTLRVASLDPDLWPLLERGLLHEDLTAAGFGLDPGLVVVKRPRQTKTAPKQPDRRAEERRRRARERLRRAEATLAEAEERVRSAQRDAKRAAAEVERARKALEEA